MVRKTMRLGGRKYQRRMGGGSCGCANNAAPYGQSAGAMPRTSAKRSYRKRVATSKCRGLMTPRCRRNKMCKMAYGKKRSFCRKKKNIPRITENIFSL